MSNLGKACTLASEWVALMGGLDNISYLYGDDVSGLIHAIHDAGLLAPDVQVIRTPEELEALELDDADAIVLASEAGVVRTVRALAAMHRLGSVWGLPAVIIATGAQVRAAREAMEIDNDF